MAVGRNESLWDFGQVSPPLRGPSCSGLAKEATVRQRLVLGPGLKCELPGGAGGGGRGRGRAQVVQGFLKSQDLA